MKYSEIDSIECCNGFGWGVSLYTQGCHFHCKGCFNPETWDFDGGKEFTEKEQNIILSLMDKDYIKRFSVIGGEPLEERNISALVELIGKIKTRYPEKKVWLYTGYTAEEVLGAENVGEFPRTMGGEDFSFMLLERPGCLFRLGMKDAEHNAPVHNERFDFNDKAIAAGAAVMASIALNRMKG